MLFFFDTDDGERRHEDRCGVELSGIEAARCEAAKLVFDLAHAGLMPDGRPRTIVAILRNAEGVELCRATATLRHR